MSRAAQLADEIGLEHLTITRVARNLGIVAPGIYRHVRDQADLVRGISQLAYQQAATELAASCVGLAGMEALTVLAHGLRRWAHKYPGRYAALQIAPHPTDARGQHAATPLLEVVRAVIRGYDLCGDSEIDAIRIVRSALHGFISLELNGGFRYERSVDATFQQMLVGLDLQLCSMGRGAPG
ncbi:TetR-like C-terminal domain-containing protein [Buchananella hordeovulneris]|uniref:TetR-like C-terminal domain-containing protein n=1 Tax=Buchananella hordeovulneris TaxID=52770 RepID=UPI000F5ED6D5|nr:TetR-like C-terminal domain-containing protein [Buchananella hordeovulneris]MDO5081670.1 TetR-like C-terminal domain-containing protein [Buchananella hordeovulneris]RRD45089.1 TetR/AcrR family transcriptional regulator [Buchananella hordeovulneris]RRD53099.1 TetR/AcrR family transcriptional regulator [Buchananella hordeovulneris]